MDAHDGMELGRAEQRASAVDDAEAIDGLISDILAGGPRHDDVTLALRPRRGLSNNGRRFGVEVLEHSDSGNVTFEDGLSVGDPAHGHTRADGCSHALNDEIIEPPIVDGNLLEFVAEYCDPDLPDPKLITEERKHTDARPARG